MRLKRETGSSAVFSNCRHGVMLKKGLEGNTSGESEMRNVTLSSWETFDMLRAAVLFRNVSAIP